MITYEEFIDGLKKIFSSPNRKVYDEEDVISVYSLFDEHERKMFGIDKDTIIKAINHINDNGIQYAEGMLFSSNKCEISVNNYKRMIRSDDAIFVVKEQGVNLGISYVSNEYCVCMIVDYGKKSLINPGVHLYHIIRSADYERVDGMGRIFRMLSVKLESDDSLSVKQYKKMISSYLFNVAYLHDAVFTTNNNPMEIDTIRNSSRRNGQLYPYKHYNQELLKYYNQATMTEAIFAQYLAYYHVLEFFFQSISEEEAIGEIQRYIMKPGFSPSDRKDVKDFYEKIKKKIRTQKEEGVWDEKNGLLLTLKKYVVDLGDLRHDLEQLKQDSVDYYKTNSANILADNAKTIDFDMSDDKVYESIRDRVYAVRNSIVHSKEGEKLKYEPFKHDKELAKEIPLIRVLAEHVIINSARNMDSL